MYTLTADDRNYLNKKIEAHYLYHDVDIDTFFGIFSIKLGEEFFGIITIKWTYKESTGELIPQLIHIDPRMIMKCNKIIHSAIFRIGV